MTTESQHTEECRKAFEKWHGGPLPQTTEIAGDSIVLAAWQGWQAAWNAHPAIDAIVADYEEVLADHRRLVRGLDVAIHGEEGAATQASLCDLIGPARKMGGFVKELVVALEFYANDENWHSPNSSARGYHVTDQNGSMDRYHSKVGGFLHGCFVPDAGDRARAALGKANPTGQVVKAVEQTVDWTEDFEERGNYQCKCRKCGCDFKGHKTRPLCKVCALPPCPDIEPIRKLAREVGYAVGEHGSKIRDYDLIAAPWTDEAVGNAALIEHLCKGLNAKVVDGPSRKPCGRYAVCIQISDRWLKHIDLSIMPRVIERKTVEVEDIDAEIAIAEAIAVMDPKMAYEEKGVPVLKWLKQLGYKIVTETEAEAPKPTGQEPKAGAV